MKIHITKTNGLNVDSMDVEISDQDLLKLGRRYFELASGNSAEKETTFDEWKEKELKKDPEFRKEYMKSIAHDVKMYCNKFISCKNCPLCLNPGDNDGGGIYMCPFDGRPNTWEV